MKDNTEEKNKDNNAFIYSMGMSPQEAIKQQQSESIKVKNFMNKHMTDNRLEA